MAKSSKEFLSGLTALADDLRKQIDANLDGWDTNPAAIAERRRKVCDPVNGYEYWDRNYFPHYGRAEPSDDGRDDGDHCSGPRPACGNENYRGPL